MQRKLKLGLLATLVSAFLVSNAYAVEMVHLEGGKFLMGSAEDVRQRGEDESLHEVSLSPFYLSPTEVSQAQYQEIMGENPSFFEGSDLPVENVDFYKALEFCNRLSVKEGLEAVYSIEGTTVTVNLEANGYRLPTEAEWEYAARAGSQDIFNDKNQITSDDANFQGSYPYLIEENYVQRQDPNVRTSENRATTIEVKSLNPNKFGLYHMLGNVSEWCFDYYGQYDLSLAQDPKGPSEGVLRVNRGGGFNDFAKHLRLAYRSANNPLFHDRNLGFRVARNDVQGSGTFTTTYKMPVTLKANPKILIAYFSHTGNTESAALYMREVLGCDIVKITMQEPYRGNIYAVSGKDLMDNYHVPISTHVDNIQDYDVILLGYPTWWATMPMAVYTFVESHDLSGKLILPFSSHGGTIFGDSISDLSKLTQSSYVGMPFEFYYSGGSSLHEDLISWLKGNGIEVAN